MAKRKSRFLKQQQLALGLIAVIVLASAAFLGTQLVKDAPLGEFIEGEHYVLIENPRRIRSDSIEVMEFFSYACIHCFNLDPDLTDWAEAQGDKVNFVRTPGVASDHWRHLGRVYFTLEQFDDFESLHTRLFSEIHRNGNQMDSKQKFLEFAVAAGLDSAEVESVYEGTSVNNSLSRADEMARRLRISTVPTMVVHGKYLVRTNRTIGLKRMIDVVEYLVEKESTRPD